MPSGLALQLLGPFQATLNGKPLTGFPTRAVQALLIYLASHPEGHRREALMAMLWPEMLQKSAQSNLRQALYLLRQAIPEVASRGEGGTVPLVLADRHTVQLNPDARCDLDVTRFTNLLKGPEEVRPEAAARYRGDFLADFYLPDSAPFEAWANARRADLRRQLMDALDKLAAKGMEEGELERAEHYARRQLSFDDLSESAHRQLIEILARHGRRSEALAQYESCRRLLDEELGVAPTAETEALVEAIRSGEYGAARQPAAAPSQRIAHQPPFLEKGARQDGATRPVFVARQRQLARMDALLEEALAGDGRILFVTGGPGRGKSALMAEFARRAQETHPDLLVAAGNCNAFSGMGDPYLPFREVMGMLTGDVEAQYAARSIGGEQARRLWRAAPKVIQGILDHGPFLLGAILPGRALLSRAATMSNDSSWLEQLKKQVERERIGIAGLEQSHLFQQLNNVLSALTVEQPVLLLLDDLQWADTASMSLLFHLGRRFPGKRILVACAYRPEEVALGRDGERHPLEKVLAEFKRTYGDVWIDLGRAEEKEGRQFVDALLETESNRLGEPFRAAMAAHTGGHALFTVELLRALQERGDLICEDGDWVEGPALDWKQLPARVEATIAERIDRLEEQPREILSIASVEGETFTAQVVARVQEIGERDLLGVLSRDLEQRHRLVREQGERKAGSQQASQYRFSHALFQQYLYEKLSAGERRLLHGEVAAALEALYEGMIEEIAAPLAHHYSRAGMGKRALKYLEMAGFSAETAYAFQEAENHFRHALALDPPHSQRVKLLSGFGATLRGQRRVQEACQTWEEAIELCRTLGPEGLDELALLYGALAFITSFESPPEALKLCQIGLEAVAEAPNSTGLGRLLQTTARAYYFSGFPNEAWDYCRQAMGAAKRLGDVRLEADVLSTQGILPGQPAQESINTLTKAVELAELDGNILTLGRALNNLGCRMPDLRARHECFLRIAALRRLWGFPDFQPLANGTVFLLRLGWLEEAERTLQTVRHRMAELEVDSEDTIISRLAEAGLLVRQGEWAEAIVTLRECQADARQRGDRQHLMEADRRLAFALMEAGILRNAAGAGYWEEAELALTEAVEMGERTQTLTENPTLQRCHLIKLWAHQGQSGEAHALLAEARTIRDAAGLQINQITEAYLLSAEAVLVAAEGRYAEAITIFSRAIETFDQLGMRWDYARNLIDWAEAHLGRNEPGDLEEARRLLQESLTMFQEMGAPGYEAVVKEKLEKRVS